MSTNLHKWFRNPNNLLLRGSSQNELPFENGLDAQTSGDGERAGSKLAKAEQLGIKILPEQQFGEMLSA